MSDDARQALERAEQQERELVLPRFDLTDA